MASWRTIPGATAANTAITLPPQAPPFAALKQVLIEPEAGSTATPTIATIVTSVPSGGLTGTQVYWDAATKSYTYAAAIAANTAVELEGWEIGQLSQVI